MLQYYMTKLPKSYFMKIVEFRRDRYQKKPASAAEGWLY